MCRYEAWQPGRRRSSKVVPKEVEAAERRRLLQELLLAGSSLVGVPTGVVQRGSGAQCVGPMPGLWNEQRNRQVLRTMKPHPLG